MQDKISSARLDLEFEDDIEVIEECIERIWSLEKQFAALVQHEQAREIKHWVIAEVFRKMDLIEDVFIGRCYSSIEEVKLRMKRGDRPDNVRRSIWTLQRKCYDLEARKISRTLPSDAKAMIGVESVGVRAGVLAEDIVVDRCLRGIEEVKFRMKRGDISKLNTLSFRQRIEDVETRKKLRAFLNLAKASQRQVVNAETGVVLDICELLECVDCRIELCDLKLKPQAQKMNEKAIISRPSYAAACAADVESHVKDRPLESDMSYLCEDPKAEEKVCENEYIFPPPQ